VLRKGDEVYCEGSLKLNAWTGQDGQQRSGLNVSARKCELLGAIGRRAPKGKTARSAPSTPPAELEETDL